MSVPGWGKPWTLKTANSIPYGEYCKPWTFGLEAEAGLAACESFPQLRLRHTQPHHTDGTFGDAKFSAWFDIHLTFWFFSEHRLQKLIKNIKVNSRFGVAFSLHPLWSLFSFTFVSRVSGLGLGLWFPDWQWPAVPQPRLSPRPRCTKPTPVQAPKPWTAEP